jgi:hypothetical protein
MVWFMVYGLWFMVPNTTFNNISVISWRSVLLMKKKHWPVASCWQTLSHNVVSSTPRHERDSNSQLNLNLIISCFIWKYLYVCCVNKLIRFKTIFRIFCLNSATILIYQYYQCNLHNTNLYSHNTLCWKTQIWSCWWVPSLRGWD